MVLSIPMGMLADRIGRKTLMILGLIVSGAAMAGMAFSTGFFWLILFVITSGLGRALFNPAALSLLSDSVPSTRQGTAMGIYGGLCQNSGVIAGSALGGFFWGTLGPKQTFLFGTLTSGLGVVISLVFLVDRPKIAQRRKVTSNL